MKREKPWPSISVVMPTLNSQRTLEESLVSIIRQNYNGHVEIVIADGGSTDRTLEIAKKYKARIVKNRLQTGEAGKAAGTKVAKGEIFAFIDSDNVLPGSNWLSKMVKPFLETGDVIASEPLYFTYRKKDYYLTRYFALLGMGDPLNLFIGNYDRYSYISDKWTEIKVENYRKRGYLLVFLKDQIPTIGANGFIIRREILQTYPIKDYLFDIDVLKFLSRNGQVKIAKVRVGIIHLFSGDILTFLRKQRRRIRDYIYFNRVGIRAVEQNKTYLIWGVIKFIISTIIIIPLLTQMITGYVRKKDKAWFFHPVACWLTLLAYGFEYIRSFIDTGPYERSKWKQ